MNWSEFRNLDPNNIGNWPTPAKAAVIGFGCVVLLGLGWYFDTNDQRLLLEQVEGKEQTLKQDFEAKQSKVVNLDALKEQLQDIKQSFGDMLKRLPNKTEVAALLVDISQQGLGAGLEFELF
ncbi:MAG: type 4a pilus biogenesis protein PilO, partial [Gammaproteobacteria bacterium]|nr:type 4a pilus biogenesis protein PilO [Gammaproteobacteria bacterium]